MVDYQKLKSKFAEIYGRDAKVFRAPGRVNLIGDHTDYNDGFVLPMAIERETAIAVSKREDRRIRAYTVNFDESGEFDLDAETGHRRGFWLNYIEGVARILERKGFRLDGADLAILSDVPSGAGLSSSAALETAVGLALTEISNQKIDRTTLALVGQQAEHEFVGANVGIMDQFVSANARKAHALLLDCRSLAFDNVPLDASRTAIVICDTRVKHNLATSAYNTRREECEKGVELLKKFLPNIRQLRDVSVSEFEKYESNLPETIRKRCRHVVTENARTLEAAEALRQNDLKEFGRLMFLSHASLRDDYDVSCAELDLLVEIAENFQFVLGARMTGGGFGGSTVNLVTRENLSIFIKEISGKYEEKTGIEPAILVSDAAGGASELILF